MIKLEFEYRIENHEDHAVVKLPKKLIPYSSQFRETLQSLYNQGYTTIILDCKYLKMLDANSIGGIVVLQRKLKEQEGKLKLINVDNDHIKYLFRNIELNKIVDVEEI